MKFTDKHGNDVECSVEEYNQLFGVGKQEKPTKYTDVVVEKMSKGKWNIKYDWLKIIDAVYEKTVKNQTMSATEVLAEFIPRNKISGYHYIKIRDGIKEKYEVDIPSFRPAKKYIPKRQKTKCKKKQYKRHSTNKGSSQRMTFIQSRVKYLCKLDTRLSYEDAFTRASQEWMNHKKKGEDGKVRVKVKNDTMLEPFPSIYPITEQSILQLQNLVKHIVGNKGTRLGYFDVKSCCETQQGLEWSGRLYYEFTNQFMLNSNKIARFFGVKDKFRIIKSNNFHYITYNNIQER